MCKAPIRIPLDQINKVPICIKCKFYIPPCHKGIMLSNKKNGLCAKSGMFHVVDGTVEYQNVEIYREYHCKGKLYELSDVNLEISGHANQSIDDCITY